MIRILVEKNKDPNIEKLTEEYGAGVAYLYSVDMGEKTIEIAENFLRMGVDEKTVSECTGINLREVKFLKDYMNELDYMSLPVRDKLIEEIADEYTNWVAYIFAKGNNEIITNVAVGLLSIGVDIHSISFATGISADDVKYLKENL